MSVQHAPRNDVGVDVLAQTVRATPGSIALTLALDAGVIVVPLLAGLILLVLGLPTAGLWLVVAAVLALTGTVIAFARTGRTLGSLAAATRTVSSVTASPAGAHLISDLVSGRMLTLDVRRGRDPISAALAPFHFAAPAPSAPRLVDQRGPYRRPALVELDSGQKLALESALIIGRSPEAPLDAPASVYVWPDMSRTLSKSHARLEWDGTRAWITDLGSTNGTSIDALGARQPLIAFQRTPLPEVATLSLGDRTLTVVVPA